MKNKRLLLIGAVVIVLIAVVAAVLWQRGPGGRQPFVASVSVPLSGPIAFPGKAFQEAALMALDDLKDQLASAPVQVEWNDNMATPATAATIAQRQQSAGRAMLYCVGYGAELQAALPILAPGGKPVFALSFQASLTKDPLVFRNVISYKGESPVFVEYAKKRGAKKIAIVFLDLPESQEQFRQLVVPELVKNGVASGDIGLFTYAVTETDFRTVATRVAQFAPDLTIINGYQSNLVPMVGALRTSLTIRDGNVIGIFALIDLLTLTKSEVLEGIAVAVPAFMVKPSAKAQDFQRRFQTRFGRAASFNEFAGYDFALIAADVAKRLPANAPASQVVGTLQATNVEGVSGRITFDGEGDVSYPIGAAIFRAGKLVPLEER